MRRVVVAMVVAACGGGGGGGGDGGDDAGAVDGGVDGAAIVGCETDATCSGSTPYCRDGECVGCGEPGESAFCNAEICTEAGSCRPCESNAECESGACFHACIDQALVLYVEPDAPEVTACTRAAPCGLIQRAVDLLPDDEPGYVVVGPGTYMESVVVKDGMDVSMSGDGALIHSPAANLPALLVDDTRFTLLRLGLRGGTGAAGHGLRCLTGEATTRLYDVTITQSGGTGIHATGCTILAEDVELSDNGGGGLFAENSLLTLRRTRIEENGAIGLQLSESDGLVSAIEAFESWITRNAGGGVDVVGVSTDVRLQNLVIAGNGSASSGVGGIRLVTGGLDEVFFLTIAGNEIGDAAGAGVHCEGPSLAIGDSIVYDNVGGTGQLDGCTVAYSVVGPGSDFESETVTSDDPAFADAPAGNYDLTAGSSAIGCAGRTSTAHDIHGDPRDGDPDCGADEFSP